MDGSNSDAVVVFWCGPSSANGPTINALKPGHKADLAGGAYSNDTQAEIAAAKLE